MTTGMALDPLQINSQACKLDLKVRFSRSADSDVARPCHGGDTTRIGPPGGPIGPLSRPDLEATRAVRRADSPWSPPALAPHGAVPCRRFTLSILPTSPSPLRRPSGY